MRIKTLEICGFKSFADKARLHFGDGITGVVGPNGCGKSNVVDAIRWVMGEMSAKHLRGKAMQDVIFGGSSGRGPQGMAEVTLVFDNDGDVPAAYLSASEISVTRRLYRDGSSEYLLNKVQVRLRDITDLFLGTGVGTRAYSIIEQGRISFVVSAKPEERRSLIEEVAGITKFKVRKKAAERRMESTEQNLARVNDVVQELERQLVTLRRQAQRAQAYCDLKEKLRDIELHRASHDWLRMRLMRASKAALTDALAQSIGDSQRDLQADEASLEAAQLALLETETVLAQLQQDSAQRDTAVAGLERDVAHWREQASLAQQQGERAQIDAAETALRLQQSEAEAQRLAEQSEDAEQGAQTRGDEVAQVAESVAYLAEELAEIDAQLASLRRDAMEHVQGAAQQRAALDSLERRLHDVSDSCGRSSKEHDALLPERAAALARGQALEEQLASLVAQLADTQGTITEQRQALPEHKQQQRELTALVQARQAELNKRSSRLESLQEIVQRLDGYSDGVRLLLGEDGPKLEGIESLVAELLDVPPSYERAIEAVLGERLQYLWVTDRGVASRAILALNEAQGGRSGFIPADVCAPDQLRQPPRLQGEGLLAQARDVVRARAGGQDLVDALLGRVILVDSLQTAQREAQAHPGAPYIWVSQDGEMMDGLGIVTGGSANGAGLLANRREIRELLEQTSQLQEALSAAEAQRQAQDEAVALCETTLRDAERRLHQVELEALSARKNKEANAAEQQRLQQRMQALQAAIAEQTRAQNDLTEQIDTLCDSVEQAEAERDASRERLEGIEERRHVQASQHAEHSAQLTDLKVSIAAQHERAQAAAQARVRLQASIADLHNRQARAQHAQSESQAQVEALRQQADAGAATLLEQITDAQQARGAFEAQRGLYEDERQRLAALEQGLKEQRRGEGGMQEQLTQARLQLQKLALEQQTLESYVLERHDAVLGEILLDYHDRPAPTAAAKKEQAVMERELKAMGAINLTAIEECAEVDGRCTFLRNQRDDLEDAIGALRQAIARINRTSRERFREAFDAVNGMFQQVYPRLFHGGSARLELTGDDDDVLEAGVDIIAMPPGKKLQNVSLLSGGEKALTATALVFSIFLIKPSPFCILDEVDAPLDEANVGRFNEMLREISKVSQFIVITHNKQTMLQMDRLYGITMEEAGMSKVVAVDLQKRQEGRAA